MFLKEIKNAWLHLAFPHLCAACGSDLTDSHQLLCLRCIASLPQTGFAAHAGNPVEKLFRGRLALGMATAEFYFTKDSIMQRLMHEFKYRRNRGLGNYLGGLMGRSLAASVRFSCIDALVPLPLHAAKEKKRGFNQANILCAGISGVLQRPVLKQVVRRVHHTETQTRKGRLERWQNMEGKFNLTGSSQIEGRHVLLVDDVITTGATLEACGRELLRAPDLRLSIASLCFSAH